MSDNSEDRSPEDLQQAWKEFEAQHGDAYTKTLQNHHEAVIHGATLEPGTPEVKLGSSVIRISAKPRHPRYGEPAPESLSARRDPATLEAITTGIEKKSPDSMDAYMRLSKAWYADYDEWQDAQKTPAYVVHTPWKCPSPPPLPEDQGTFVGSIANGFHIEARDETGTISIYLTNLDVPSEALSYLEYFLTQWQSVDPNTFEDKILYATQSLNEIRPQTADQQRADHEFLGQILKGLIEVARQPTPQLIHETTDATGFGIARSHDTKHTLPTRSTTARLLNGPEIQLMVSLTSNYSNRDQFQPFPSHKIVIYTPKGKTKWQAMLNVEDALRGTWDDADEQRIKEIIWAQVDKLGNTTRDDALIAVYVLYKLATSETGIERVSFTELLDLENKTKLGAADREKRAKEYDAVFRLWQAWMPIGRREWRDPKTGKVRIIEEPSPLFVYQGPFYANGQGPLTGMYKGPLGFTFLDSAMTKEYRADPALCHFFGTLQDLAQIPAGKVPGDWARSIGLTAAQIIRNNSKNGGPTMKLTRRFLLTTHTPNTPVQKILDGDDPGRARKYWTEAINILKERGPLASVEETPTNFPRKDWDDAWLDQTVTVTLGASWADAPMRVFARTQERKALKAKKGKAKKGG